jgi:hypothetical protein
MAFPYVKQTWTDNVSSCSAARNTVHEDGIVLAGAAGISATPPGSPVDGMIWRLSMGSGVFWFFQYDSAQATYKWVFMGGPPMLSEVVTTETTTTTTYVALATAGPSVALTRAGIYDVEISANLFQTTGGTGRMSYDIGGTGAVDADSISEASTATGIYGIHVRRKTIASASTTLTAKYKTSANTLNAGDRIMRVAPVQII